MDNNGQNSIEIKISSENIDIAIEKANRLKSLLIEIKELIDSL